MMKEPRIWLVLVLVCLTFPAWGNLLFELEYAISLAQDLDDVELAYTAFLDSKASLLEVFLATESLSRFNKELRPDYLPRRKRLEPAHFNVSVALIFSEDDTEKALHACRLLILANRENPDAYRLMVMQRLRRMPSMLENRRLWLPYHQSIVQDAGYFRAFHRLSPRDAYAAYGYLLLGIASADMELASAGIRGILREKRILSEDLDIEGVLLDPAYMAMITLYLRDVEAALGDKANNESVFYIANHLAHYYIAMQEWEEILDTFSHQTYLRELELVKIGLISAYDYLGRHEEADNELTGEGLPRAVEIVSFWRRYYRGAGLDHFLESFSSRYPESPILEAILLDPKP